MPTATKAEIQYQAHKARQRTRYQTLSKVGRDIGPIPPIGNPRRRIECQGSFQRFCEVYFPQTFFLPWGSNHLEAIARIEQVVLRGGLFALAMPRGSGKTSLCEAAVIWATLAGYRKFVVFIGSDLGHAQRSLEDIKTELGGNDFLAEDFPEAIYPLQKLEGIALRSYGQTYMGERVQSTWNRGELVFPTIPGSISSGTIVRVAGIDGAIRGMKIKRTNGTTARPDLVIIDDPQTDQSARSPSQVDHREEVLMGAVLGLAGPGKKISGIVPCTVIAKDDLADRILDRTRCPRWQGQRHKMMDSLPTDMELWAQYGSIQEEDLQTGGDGSLATEFYRVNREAMDAGAKVSWKERYNDDEISAIQAAMNLYLTDEDAFMAEYQNEPKLKQLKKLDLSAADIVAKMNGFERGIVPDDTNFVSMFVDVQGVMLFHVVVAWRTDFTGYIIDYGTTPDQRSNNFTLSSPKVELKKLAPNAGLEGRLTAGLKSIEDEYLTRGWPGADGKTYRIGRCIIDANWAASTDVVYSFCQKSLHAAILTPSHGYYVGASSRPMDQYTNRPGDQAGTSWRIPRDTNRRPIRHLIYDTNFWKSFSHARFLTAEGDPGCLSLWGRNSKRHNLFANHVTAEYYVRTYGRNREVDEWKQRPSSPDNHWFDCLVGCCVGGSMLGAVVPGQEKPTGGARTKRTVSLAAAQKAREGRGI